MDTDTREQNLGNIFSFTKNKQIGILGSAPLIAEPNYEVIVRINRGVRFLDADIWAAVSGPARRMEKEAKDERFKYKYKFHLIDTEVSESSLALHRDAFSGTRTIWWFLTYTSPREIIVDGMPCFVDGNPLPRNHPELQEFYYTPDGKMVSGKHYINRHKPEIDRNILAHWHEEGKIKWLNL